MGFGSVARAVLLAAEFKQLQHCAKILSAHTSKDEQLVLIFCATFFSRIWRDLSVAATVHSAEGEGIYGELWGPTCAAVRDDRPSYQHNKEARKEDATSCIRDY